ncbi:MAG TPA: MarR family transcriptional regulator [Gemmatirosa sp.]
MPTRRPARAAPDAPDRNGAGVSQRRRMLVITAWIRTVRAYLIVSKTMERTFRAHGLTPPQFDILATLHRLPGISQQELADRMLVTKANVSFILRGMEAAGWVERRADAHDARLNLLHLTATARDTFAGVLADHDRVLAQALDGFSDDELQTVAALMSRLGPPAPS